MAAWKNPCGTCRFKSTTETLNHSKIELKVDATSENENKTDSPHFEFLF